MSKHHNQKVAQNRGSQWRQNLVLGKMESSQNPTILKLERVKNGIPQILLAHTIETSVNSFGSIERGKRPVSKERAMAIASFFGRRINRLFEPVGNKFIAKSAKKK
jgi:DNA-binding XRE family transcriptional regulator